MPGTSRPRSDGFNPAIQYDGFTFPPALKVTLEPKPIYSPSGRTLARIEMTLQIECVISSIDFDSSAGGYSSQNADLLTSWSASNPDANVNSNPEINSTYPEIDSALYMLISKLSKPGKDLYIYGYGFGEYNISNVERSFVTKSATNGKSVPDLANGPHPRFVSIRNMLNASTAKVVWEVIFSINPCLQTEEQYFATDQDNLALDFSIETQIKATGVFSRIISGKVIVANFVDRLTSKSIFLPDAMSREHGIVEILNKSFPLLATCNREISYLLSEDRLSLSFTFTDTQIPSDEPYYPGCSSMDVQISARTVTPLDGQTFVVNGKSYDASNAVRAEVSISGSVEVQKSFPKATAFNVLVNVINTYIMSNPDLKESGFIVKNFGLTNNVFSRGASFYINYFMTIPINDIAAKTLVFYQSDRTQAGKDWIEWSKQRYNDQSGYGFEGNGNLQPHLRNDFVTHACEPRTDETITSGHTGASSSITKNT